MTEEIWSADKAILDTVRGHIFDMEDHLGRAEEGVTALAGLVELKDAHAYRAAVNCIADVLIEEIGGIRAKFRLAMEGIPSEDEPSLKAVEE